MRRRAGERLSVIAARVITYCVVAVTGYLLLDILLKGLPALNWHFLTEAPRNGGMAGGIFPAIAGTVLLVAGAILVAFPLGIITAIYLAEYADQGVLTQLVRIAIITLAGIPSIVFGLFGLGLFVLFLHFGTSLLAGSLTLACMVLPVIIAATEEALAAVPPALREGSLALGATRWQTIWHNVLPYAVPGMLTGAILAIGRAAGETAPILLTAVAFLLPHLPQSPCDPVMALPYHLYVLATQALNPAAVRDKQYGTALVLLMLVLGMNAGAIVLRSYLRRKIKW